MTYEKARREAIERLTVELAGEFARRIDPGRPTVVLIPGGMGSHLEQACQRWDEPTRPAECMRTVWLDLGLLWGDALRLELDPAGRDHDGRIIRARGALRFFLRDPYNATASALRRVVNFGVFAFDWRRGLTEAADLLRLYLAALDQAVAASSRGTAPRVRDRLTLLGHSMGGLVARLMFARLEREGAEAVASPPAARVVTVGTPFYGAGTHMRRYYVGEPLLNLIHKDDPQAVTRIMASMPGPYVLLPPSRHAFAQYLAQAGGDAELADYPVVDAGSGEPTDPFDPAHHSRFPAGVPERHLQAARLEMLEVARALPPALAKRFHHVRTLLRLRGRPESTPARFAWKRLTSPTAPLPRIGDAMRIDLGPGDGTVPLWSAAHAQTPREQVVTIAGPEHEAAIEHPAVLNAVICVAAQGQARPIASARPVGPPVAPLARIDARTEALIERLRAAGPEQLASFDPSVLRRLFRSIRMVDG